MVSDKIQTVKGSLKTFKKAADSGNEIISYFCGECGTTIYRKTSSAPGAIVIKTGTIDDNGAAEEGKPDVEQFVRSRVSWIPAVPGVNQIAGGWVPED